MKSSLELSKMSSDNPQNKRFRAGSISGRLRTASDLEERGVIDKVQKGMIKDLIISGDSTLQNALDNYEKGETKQLQDLINAGLLNRKNSIDILDGLDLGFLQLKGRNRGISTDSTFSYSGFDDDFFFDGQFNDGNQSTFGEDILELDDGVGLGRKNSLDIGSNKNFRANSLIDNSKNGGIADGKTDSNFEMGDMNFEWDGLGGNYTNENRHNSFQGFGIEADLTPGMNIDMSAYEFLAASLQDSSSKPRKRHTKTGDSNELKSNLKNNLKTTSGSKTNSSNSSKSIIYNKSQTNKSQTNLTKTNSTTSKTSNSIKTSSVNQNLKNKPNTMKITLSSSVNYNSNNSLSNIGGNISINDYQIENFILNEFDDGSNQLFGGQNSSQRKPTTKKEKTNTSGVYNSDGSSHNMSHHSNNMNSSDSPLTNSIGNNSNYSTGNNTDSNHDNHHIGTIISHGKNEKFEITDLNIANREKGYVGAYSPEARKMRIQRFIEKRGKRVWTKKVKYDVRKNFADSRIRVKGRFVKKEDEEMMRELKEI